MNLNLSLNMIEFLIYNKFADLEKKITLIINKIAIVFINNFL